ncbi:MAG: polysaccharide deacetylase family protein [Ruminococcus sp.]|nr:polysaccharide deacetylase family protein [Candidatus Copronaster equi]
MEKYAVITMDVEDWYHTYFPEENVDRSKTLLDGLDVALDIMDKKNIKGSFFVVGEIADRLADKIRKMDKNGHDIAVHNYVHIRPLSMEKKEYKEQLTESKTKIENILGHKVAGYRAPSFGIDDEHLEVVQECGFSYDSSKLQPQKSEKYGVLNLNGFEEVYPCIYKKDNFTEFEVSTQNICGMNMLLGGGYIRMLPWLFMKHMTKKYLDSGKPYVMYIHPIDLSPKPMPDVDGISFDRYLRTHIGRRHMVRRFKKVIEMLEKNGYQFVTFEQLRNKNLGN